MKYLLTADTQEGTVIDGDTLHRWIDVALAAAAGDEDAIQVLPLTSGYIARRLAVVVNHERAYDD